MQSGTPRRAFKETFVQAKYICPSCWHKSTLQPSYAFDRPRRIYSGTPSIPQLKSTRHSVEALNRRRLFHTSTARTALDSQSTLLSDNFPPNAVVQGVATDIGIELERDSSNRSFIRRQLRAWSDQQQKIRKEKGLDTVPSVGKIFNVPNALSIDQRQEGEEEEENDELEQEGDYDDLIEGETSLHLKPGDLFVLNIKSIRSQFAIFIGQQEEQHQLLLADGRWVMEHLHAFNSWICQDFATEEEVEDIRQRLPKEPFRTQNPEGPVQSILAIGDLPSKVTQPLVRRMATLAEEAFSFRRSHIATLDSSYDLLADEDAYEVLPFDEIGKQLFGEKEFQPSHGAQIAIYDSLSRDPGKFTTFQKVGGYLYVLIVPKRLSRHFETVTRWAREYQEYASQAAIGKDVSGALKKNPLNDFIEKARRLILKSRKNRSPTTIGSLGPSSTDKRNSDGQIETLPTDEIYSDADKMILNFLWDTFVRFPQRKRGHRHHSIGSLILRAIGAYPKLRLEKGIGRLLLQELGSMSPWNDGLDADISCPIPNRPGAKILQEAHDEAQRYCDDMKFDGTLEGLPLSDSMAHLRRDWGDMEAFCLDSPTTNLLDDAVSLEPHESIADAYWIHTHISHPSAFIDPNHVIARRARLMGTAVYHSSDVFALMPASFIQSLSLASKSPVLTISTLILSTGEVKNVTCSVGRINRVVRLATNTVHLALGHEIEEQASMVVGKGPLLDTDVTTTEALGMASKHLDTLRTLERLADARIKYRQTQVPEYADFETLLARRRIALSVSAQESYNPLRLTQSYHYAGDPKVSVQAPRRWKQIRYSQYFESSHLIERLMTMACESAGLWLKERNIPALFQGTLTDPAYPLSRLNKLSIHEEKIPPLPKISSTPIPHVSLNVAQYVQVTSPLRRYNDLLAQWQIDAYLKAQATIPGPVSDGDTIPNLPFSKKDIDDYIPLYYRTTKVLGQVPNYDAVHWTFNALFRAFHFKEAALPDVWDVLLIKNSSRGERVARLDGLLVPFGIKARFFETKEGWETTAEKGQYVPARIELVDPIDKVIHVMAVGPPSDLPSQNSPIHICSAPKEGSQGST